MDTFALSRSVLKQSQQNKIHNLELWYKDGPLKQKKNQLVELSYWHLLIEQQNHYGIPMKAIVTSSWIPDELIMFGAITMNTKWTCNDGTLKIKYYPIKIYCWETDKRNYTFHGHTAQWVNTSIFQLLNFPAQNGNKGNSLFHLQIWRTRPFLCAFLLECMFVWVGKVSNSWA